MPGGARSKGRVILDLNSPEFLDVFLQLERDVLVQVVDGLQRLRGMEWTAVYASKGLNWEQLHYEAPNGSRVYSFRLSRKARGVGYREGDFLRVVSLHPDHDSAHDR